MGGRPLGRPFRLWERAGRLLDAQGRLTADSKHCAEGRMITLDTFLTVLVSCTAFIGFTLLILGGFVFRWPVADSLKNRRKHP